MALQDSRRMGRQARLAARAAPLAENLRPVWPGMESGRYRPLDDHDVLRIHRASRRLRAILDSHYPTHIPSHIDDRIREAFPVRLPREAARMA